MTGKTTLGLKLIGIWKLISAGLLVAAGFGIFRLLKHEVSGDVEQFIVQLHLDPKKHLIQSLLARLTGIEQGRLREIGAGTFFYAALYAAEGIGLLKARHWAEYLTIFATSSFLPLEAYEIIVKSGPMPVLVFAVNLGIVVYLVRQLKRDQAGS